MSGNRNNGPPGGSLFGFLGSVFDNDPFFQGFGLADPGGVDSNFGRGAAGRRTQISSTAREIPIEGPDDDIPAAQHRLTGPLIHELPDHEEQGTLFLSSSQPDHVQEPGDETHHQPQQQQQQQPHPHGTIFVNSSPPPPPPPPASDQRAAMPAPATQQRQTSPLCVPASIRMQAAGAISQETGAEEPGSPLLVHLQEGMLRGGDTPRHHSMPTVQADWLTGDLFQVGPQHVQQQGHPPLPQAGPPAAALLPAAEQAAGVSVCTPTGQPSAAGALMTSAGAAAAAAASHSPARPAGPSTVARPSSGISGAQPGGFRAPPAADGHGDGCSHPGSSMAGTGGGGSSAPQVGKRQRRPSSRSETLQAAAAVVSASPAPQRLRRQLAARGAAVQAADEQLGEEPAGRPQKQGRQVHKRWRDSSLDSDEGGAAWYSVEESGEDPDWQPSKHWGRAAGPPALKRRRSGKPSLGRA